MQLSETAPCLYLKPNMKKTEGPLDFPKEVRSVQSLESWPQVHVKTSGGPTVAGYGAVATLSTQEGGHMV